MVCMFNSVCPTSYVHAAKLAEISVTFETAHYSYGTSMHKVQQRGSSPVKTQPDCKRVLFYWMEQVRKMK